MIKEVLQSNMQLRDDLLKLSSDYEVIQGLNYQYKVENEDLRDRLNLLSEEKLGGVSIDYLPYIPKGSVEVMCDNINTAEELRNAKIAIFSHIFSV